MTRVAFIGLGNMGSGMAANQAKAGREVVAFDLSADALNRAKEQGMTGAASAAEACKNADIVITMLPAGQHVRDVYAEAILINAPKDALLIDCSTIDVDSARTVSRDASMQGFRSADAPVSGGTAAANAGTLTFMVGCREQDFAELRFLGPRFRDRAGRKFFLKGFRSVFNVPVPEIGKRIVDQIMHFGQSQTVAKIFRLRAGERHPHMGAFLSLLVIFFLQAFDKLLAADLFPDPVEDDHLPGQRFRPVFVALAHFFFT